MTETPRLTLATGGKHEGFRVFFTHPVYHIYLLQCLSDSIFVLRLTGNVGRPELKEERNIYEHRCVSREGLWSHNVPC